MEREIKYGNINYDDRFKKIECIRKHAFLLPFVGKYYDKYRILQIAESRFLPDCPLERKLMWEIYEEWFEHGKDDALVEKHPDNLNTREMFVKYCGGLEDCHSWAFRLFNSAVEKGLGIINSSHDNVHNFAFINFYQLPIPQFGDNSSKGFSLKNLKSIFSQEKNEQEINILWEKCIKEASITVAGVIDILKPNFVFFTSSASYDEYKKYCEKNPFGSRFEDMTGFRLYHSSDSRVWGRKISYYDNKTSKEVVIEMLQKNIE